MDKRVICNCDSVRRRLLSIKPQHDDETTKSYGTLMSYHNILIMNGPNPYEYRSGDSDIDSGGAFTNERACPLFQLEFQLY